LGLVYSSANRVVVSLGPEANRSGEALTLLEAMSEEVEVDWRTMKVRPSSQRLSEDWANRFIPLPFKSSGPNPVLALVEGPYFRRAWVRHEIFLAKDPVVYCELQKVSWQSFRRSVICLRLRPIAADCLERALWLR
jgi:hypothetical protein